MSTTYRATYGTKPCTAITGNHGRTFAVILDKDPRHGSMIFTRIHRTELDNLRLSLVKNR